jgi:hypothetical protein
VNGSQPAHLDCREDEIDRMLGLLRSHEIPFADDGSWPHPLLQVEHVDRRRQTMLHTAAATSSQVERDHTAPVQPTPGERRVRLTDAQWRTLNRPRWLLRAFGGTVLDEAIGDYDVLFVREPGCIVLQGDEGEVEWAVAAILARLA